MIIGHLDMDAFFASVEERDSPQFSNLPIAVGADPKNGRGVVSTANYKAREYGIHSALPISKAWQLSELAKKQGKPGVVFLEPDFEKYEKASKAVYEILKKYSSKIEQSSIDEFYFDLSGKGYQNAENTSKEIKNEIKEKLKLTCSIGVGPNKLIAKISASFKKPDGLTIVLGKNVLDFLASMPVKKIPGIGPKTEKALNDLKIRTITDLRNIPEEELKELFGKVGGDIYMKARGIDYSEIVEFYEAKSIGKQDTFLKDTLEASVIISRFKELCEEVYDNFLKSDFKEFKTISIVVRFEGFITKSSAKTLKKPISTKHEFLTTALNLLLPFLDSRKNPQKRLIRLIGVRVENLSKA